MKSQLHEYNINKSPLNSPLISYAISRTKEGETKAILFSPDKYTPLKEKLRELELTILKDGLIINNGTVSFIPNKTDLTLTEITSLMAILSTNKKVTGEYNISTPVQ